MDAPTYVLTLQPDGQGKQKNHEDKSFKNPFSQCLCLDSALNKLVPILASSLDTAVWMLVYKQGHPGGFSKAFGLRINKHETLQFPKNMTENEESQASATVSYALCLHLSKAYVGKERYVLRTEAVTEKISSYASSKRNTCITGKLSSLSMLD